ncbi:MAG: hypothetical protein KatS3mg095_0376 [Candidatus Parcubacteria bacterium]|nr:MAG: hypothetical protein KatS3mg095_0376 [Candidatus Parcubacteria bacterium]
MSKLSFSELLLEIAEKKEKYFKNYLSYGKKIKDIARELLGNCQVLIFGSVIRGDFSPASDIDVLIISNKFPENWEERRIYRTKIKSAIEHSSPFQIHLATEEEFKNWWQNFIKSEFVEIK